MQVGQPAGALAEPACLIAPAVADQVTPVQIGVVRSAGAFEYRTDRRGTPPSYTQRDCLEIDRYPYAAGRLLNGRSDQAAVFPGLAGGRLRSPGGREWPIETGSSVGGDGGEEEGHGGAGNEFVLDPRPEWTRWHRPGCGSESSWRPAEAPAR
jgi:hypothetical protein